MGNINFNDWQEISIKKEIKNISNKMNRRSPIIALIVEMFFTVCSIIVAATDLVPDGEMKKWIIISLLVLMLAVPILIVCLAPVFRQKLYAYRVRHGKISYKGLIDIFDNETNQQIMMAYSFCECIENNVKPQLITYYYIQANYYINKCILHLEAMQNYSSYVFALPLTEEGSVYVDGTKISYERVNNLLSLIHLMRKEMLEEKAEALKEIELGERANVDRESARYNRKADSFVQEYNDFLLRHNCENAQIEWKNLSKENVI